MTRHWEIRFTSGRVEQIAQGGGGVVSPPDSRWVPIPCLVADLIRQHPQVVPIAGRTDISGEFGEPCVYTEWGLRDDATPVMREWRYPSRVPGELDPQPCEHLAYNNRKGQTHE